jgi:hypothetical protein
LTAALLRKRNLTRRKSNCWDCNPYIFKEGGSNPALDF